MNSIYLLAGVTAPSDLWNNLINWLNGPIGNLGWTILLLTVLVKLITSPLDFMVKYSTKKQTLVQQKCAPQIAKIQKKFGKDQQTLRIQTNALYKREGLNMGISCLVMLFNLVLTCTIFFSFFGSLRTISAYQTINQYEKTAEVYQTALNTYISNENNISIEEANNFVIEYNEALVYISNAANENENTDKFATSTALVETNKTLMNAAIEFAKQPTLNKWNNCKSSWLWVQNIWVSDSQDKIFPSYDALKSMSKDTGYTDYVTNNINKDNYNKIASLVSSNATRQTNGYYILPILAGGITFLSQYISELHTRLKNKKANKVAKEANNTTASTMKVMRFVLPAIMVIFTLTASASFGLYILASNVASMALGELTTLIINALTRRKQLEVEAELEKEANRLIKKGQLKG